MFFCCIQLSAQNVLQVNYAYKNGHYTNDEILYIKNNEAIYVKPPINIKRETEIVENEGNNFEIKGGDIKTKNILYFLDNSKNSSLAYTISNDHEQYLVSDDNLAMEWKIGSDFKQIGDYKCRSATLSFRGRDYTAYFMDEIPVSYGPFKFMGLPGLIMELTTERPDSYHTWIVTRIKNKSEEIKLPAKEDYNVPTMILKEFVELNEDFTKDRSKASAARLPKGTTMTSSITTRLGIERVYEWEQE